MLKLRNPVQDQQMLDAIRSALASGDTKRAIALACAALDDGLENPLLFYLRSRILMQQARMDEAARDLVQAASLAAADVGMRSMCGLDLVSLQHTREAVAVLEDAVRIDPNHVPAHFNLGWAHETGHDFARALAAYERVVALNPAHAVALARLSVMAWRSGDNAGADAYAERALAVDANEFHALGTKVSVALAASAPDAAEAFVQRLLALKTLPLSHHAEALGMLGDVRHAQGRFTEAFEAYVAAGAEKQQFYQPQFGRNEAHSFSAYVRALAAHFAETSPEDARGHAGKDAKRSAELRTHAFVAGFPRSGTTLLENILAAHPDVGSLAEAPTMADAVRTFLNDDMGRKRLATLSGADAEAARRVYWQRVRDLGGAADRKVFVDENPFNTPWLPVAAKLFPLAKVIFTVRDPRDVVLSCFRRRFAMNQGMYEFVTLERTASFYADTMRLAEIYREKLGLEWIDVRHEALVENFEAEASRVCDLLGVSYASEMRDFDKQVRSRAVTTASADQVARGLNSEGIGQWRHYASELAPVMPVLAPWVEKFGYPAS